jgi:hypothetical protein
MLLNRLKCIAITVACCFVCWCAQARAQVVGVVEPAYLKPVYTPAQVATESVAFTDWLEANYTQLTQDQRDAAREHIHALVDSRVREILKRDGRIFPKQADTVLIRLYAWAGRLGVYGADQIYQALGGAAFASGYPGLAVPPGLAIQLVGASLQISSVGGQWQARVPYYYFPFGMQSKPDANGVLQEVVIMATASTPDAKAPGYAQAVVTMVFSKQALTARFEADWLMRLGVGAMAPKRNIGTTSFKSRKTFDEATRLHKEVVFISTDAGAFALTYAGLDGVYQTMRPQFLDFLTQLKPAS